MSEFNINEDAQSGGECSRSQSNADPTSQSQESAFPDEDEETITMLDVIEQENKLEEEASAVLGNSDEKNCTYPKGYITRQALYSCATCSEDPENMAAICLACSLECHDNHDVIELYTKRGYRCDCGNGKFKPDFECKFQTDKQAKKASINEQNKYNHNFSGRYCSCDKKYPPDENDDSAESQDDMWQCVVCEDWYHSRHLGVKELPSKFDELICGTCVEKLEFVNYYRDFVDSSTVDLASNELEESNNNVASDEQLTKQETTKVDSTSSNASDGDKDSTEFEGQENASSSTSTVGTTAPESSTSQPANQNNSTETKIKAQVSSTTTVIAESDTNDSQLENKDPSNSENQSNQRTSPSASKKLSDECLLEKYKKICEHKRSLSDEDSTGGTQSDAPGKSAPIFWTDCSWRTRLCRCEKCLLMYKTKDCEYLLDEKDTVQYYEAQGKAIARESPYERGLSALNKMNRTAVVEALHSYEEMKADLSTYFKKFAETKKVVREEDIHDFFNKLKSKKRARLEYE